MKSKVATGFPLILALSWVVADQGSASANSELIDTMRGTTLQIVRAALPKFEAQGFPLDRYEVSVFQQESSFIVLFDDPERDDARRFVR
jgi:hypothetical protein